MDKVRAWPRPIRYGLLSAVIAAMPWPIIVFLLNRHLLWLGSLAPFVIPFPEFVYFPDEYLGPDGHIYIYVLLVFVQTLLLAIAWFFIGWIIGRYTSKTYNAVLVWLGIQLLGYIIPWLLFIFAGGYT